MLGTNPPTGFGPQPFGENRVKVPSGSFNVGRRGELPASREAEPGRNQARRSGEKSPTVKSSTMKGPEGLAGHVQSETVPNGETSWSMGKRALLVSTR